MRRLTKGSAVKWQLFLRISFFSPSAPPGNAPPKGAGETTAQKEGKENSKVESSFAMTLLLPRTVALSLFFSAFVAGLPAHSVPLPQQTSKNTAELPPLTMDSFADAMKRHDTNKNEFAERIRRWFGADNLKNGPYPKQDNLRYVAAIEVPGDLPKGVIPAFVSDYGSYRLPLQRIGKTHIYAGNATLNEGIFMRWHYEIGTEHKGSGDLEAYVYPPELNASPDVPHGTLTEMPVWKSTIFPNTERRWWVYIPAQVKQSPEKPAAVMIEQDGEWAQWYLPNVLDNLIAKGDIPPTVAILINPGRFTTQKPQDGPGNRSFEYDTLSDQYARFLLEEILPEVEKTVKLRHDPAGRLVAGISSGGICAFTAAWERPQEFGKVLSWVGSFVNLASGPSGIAGGHNYPPMIRRTKDKPKPIRVFLQDGANDLDNQFGNWPLANEGMASALQYSGYDYKFVFGQGTHNDRQGKAILPDSLRWLWHDWKTTQAIP